MLRHPVIVSSLEEDFKALGLLSEEDSAMPDQSASGMAAASPIIAKKGGSKKSDPAAHPDDGEEKGKTGTDEAPGLTHTGKWVPAHPPVMKGGQSESIRGMPDKRRSGAIEGKEGDDGDDDDDDDDKDDHDEHDSDETDEEYELVGADAVTEAVLQARGGHKSARVVESKGVKTGRKNESKGLDSVSKLIEGVTAIMESIDDSHREDSVKAFANIAIISELLSRGFSNYSHQYEDKDLSDTSIALTTLAEEAGEIARTIESGEPLDSEALGEEFKAQIDSLMNALDLYSDVVESDEDLDPAALGEEEEDDDDDGDDDKPKGKKKEEAVTPPGRATGGIMSARNEAYMPYGKGGMGKKGMAAPKK